MNKIFENATDAWRELLDNIYLEGEEVVLKGTSTLEILNGSVAFNMRKPFVFHPKRKANFKFLGAEIQAITNGDNRLENLVKYNKNMAQFSDDGYILNGAYGPPFNHQLMYVVNTLRQDLLSRQAVLTIWKQNPVEAKDIRCTLSLQFMVREYKLHCFVNMRSSDIIWGVTYDFPVFVFMALRVLTLLNKEWLLSNDLPIELGNMHFNAASSHLYSRHIDLIIEIFKYKKPHSKGMSLDSSFSTDWNRTIKLYDALQSGFIPS